MATRIVILISCFLLASVLIAQASRTEPVVPRISLDALPMQIGQWTGRDLGMSADVIRVLGVDDYVNRVYASDAGIVTLYMGFYQSQRQGSTIHSPLNCLPGAGWNPIERSYIRIPSSSESTTSEAQINRILIEKGVDRQIALYWYQAHGRVVASEYWGKFYTVLDAMRMNRTDGAIIRVLSPVGAAGQLAAEKSAEIAAENFVAALVPLLANHLPE